MVIITLGKQNINVGFYKQILNHNIYMKNWYLKTCLDVLFINFEGQIYSALQPEDTAASKLK